RTGVGLGVEVGGDVPGAEHTGIARAAFKVRERSRALDLQAAALLQGADAEAGEEGEQGEKDLAQGGRFARCAHHVTSAGAAPSSPASCSSCSRICTRKLLGLGATMVISPIVMLTDFPSRPPPRPLPPGSPPRARIDALTFVLPRSTPVDIAPAMSSSPCSSMTFEGEAMPKMPLNAASPCDASPERASMKRP